MPARTEPDVRAALLKQKDAISNWQSFQEANQIKGWDNSTAICEWGGVSCADRSDPLQGFAL